jgi:hypothetical protein
MTSSQPDAPRLKNCPHAWVVSECPFCTPAHWDWPTHWPAAVREAANKVYGCRFYRSGQRITLIDALVSAALRVGQPPLDPAHPGWTLPIPPDESRPADEVEYLRLIMERFTGDDVFPAFLRGIAKEALRRSPEFRSGALPPDRPTPAPTPAMVAAFMQAIRGAGISDDDFNEDEARIGLRAALRAGGQPVSATPPEPDARLSEIKARWASPIVSRDHGHSDVQWLIALVERLRAGASPQPEDSPTAGAAIDALAALSRRRGASGETPHP